MRLYNKRPSGTRWKRSIFFLNARYCTVNKSMHNNKNQPSQSVMYSLFNNWRPLIAKSPDIPTFIIKEGRSACFASFDFWFYPGVHLLHCTIQNSWPTCKYQNIPHGDPERPPITNPNNIITNLNIENWTVDMVPS